MSWSHTGLKAAVDRGHASPAEVVECFRDARLLLIHLALLITADSQKAEQSVADALETTIKGHSPFRDWLLEWAKAATIMNAISSCIGNIRDCQIAYQGQVCSHDGHTSQIEAEDRATHLATLLETDSLRVTSELDALSRAVLVLRLGIRSSLQDCVLRLNVARTAVLAANCRAMIWLGECQSHVSVVAQPGSLSEDRVLAN